MTDVPVERFPALDDLPLIQHGFTLRVPGLDVRTDRATALERISGYHQAILKRLGHRAFRVGEQIHGNGIQVVDQRSPEKTLGVDATDHSMDDPGMVLGVYVAGFAVRFISSIR